MTKKTKTVLFPFFPFDYKAAIPFLENMAEKGWELSSVERFTATFREAKPNKSACFAEVKTLGIGEEREKNLSAYKKEWANRGLKYAASNDQIHYFYVTDKESDVSNEDCALNEKSLLNKLVWQKEWMTLLLLSAMLLVSLMVSVQLNVSRLYTYTGVLSLAIFPVFIVPFLAICGYELTWFFRTRRYLCADLPLPTSTLSKARFRFYLFYAVAGIAVIMAVFAVVADAVVKYATVVRLAGVAFAVILTVVLSCRIIVKKNTAKSQIPTVICVIFLAIMSLFAQYAVSQNLAASDKLPQGIVAITVSDLNNVSGDVSDISYTATSSPLIPKKYTYIETLSDEGMVATECYMTASTKIAEFLFNKLVSAISEDREVSLLDNGIFGVPAFSVDGKNAVLLIVDKTVVYAEARGDFGADTGIFNAVADKFIR